MTESPPSQSPLIEIETAKLALERYKLRLDFWKAIIISGFVAVAIAAIPPLFQLATAKIEYVKFEHKLALDAASATAERLKDAQTFRSTFVSGFLEKALNQDIELRLRLAEYFKYLAQGDQDFKSGWADYHAALDKRRRDAQDDIDKMERELAEIQKQPQEKRDLVEQDRLLQHLTWRRNEVGYVAPDKSVIRDPRNPARPVADNATISLDAAVIPAGRRQMAEKVIAGFASAGFGTFQQVAALANAIGDSGLNPDAQLVGPGEASYGLFQLNQKGGFGTGFTAEQLKDPDTNIQIVVSESKKSARFVGAMSLYDAVYAFVYTIDRPADPAGEVRKRFAIAQQLLK